MSNKKTPPVADTMARNQTAQASEASGVLVLGMHRSGTSALTRVLQLGGANIGSRILGSSAGNEAGHWEDAFAVETHERLLALMGRRWDDLVPLPSGWREGEAARDAEQLIGDYISFDRARHALWAVKDPRLCEFGSIWRDAAAATGSHLAALLVVRHPREVVRSLAARDAISAGHAFLLWLDHVVGSLQVAEGLSCRILSYEQLLDDWRGCADRIRELPGCEILDWDGAAAEVDAFLDPSHRHQHEDDEAGSLPELVSTVWLKLSACLADGCVPSGLGAELAAFLAPARELLTPLLGDWRLVERRLWERVSRAETQNVESPSDPIEAIDRLGSTVQRQHEDVIRVLSDDIREMQLVVAEALRRAATMEGRADAAAQLRDGIDAISTSQLAVNGFLQTQRDDIAAIATGQLSMSADVQALQAANSASQSLVRTSLESLVKLPAQVESARERIERALGAGLEGLASELQALAPELQCLAQRIADAEVASASFRRESSDARSALAAQVQSGFDGLAESVAGEVRLLQRIQAELGLNERVQQLVASNATSMARLERSESDLLATRNALGELEAARSQLLTAAADAEARAQDLEAAVASRTAMINRLKHDLEQLHGTSETLARVLESHSWRWTRPLRALTRALRGEWGSSERWAIGHALRKLIVKLPMVPSATKARLIIKTLPSGTVSDPARLPDEGMAPMVALQPAREGMPDVFMWAVIDWHFRVQRPQHLARALADRGHRVFYISNNFVDSAQPGFRLDPIDRSGRLFQVHLNLQGAPAIYFGSPGEDQLAALRASLGRLLGWSHTQASLSVVQHPYWSMLARAVPNARVVYDCMDHHAGFENNAPEVLEAESKLMSDADLVIVTSAWLEREVAPIAASTALVRNAGEFAFFCGAPLEVFRDEDCRQVIGYFGAIAEWFDVELVRRVALAHPEALVLLVGGDTIGAREQLGDLANVQMVGEVRYADLPYWLHGFDVALLPFKVIPLTLATNPVKVYEYLAAGKQVVAVNLPEMTQFGDLVRVADNHGEFVVEVGKALMAGVTDQDREARQQFAAGQTWDHRALAINEAIAAIREPLVSVIVLTYNNLGFTEACLFSIEHYSDYSNLEVIVVDNASSDGSPAWLRQWVEEPSAAGHVRRLILNDDNLGFAAGNNVGLAAAQGDNLILLNNDTYVTRGWVRTLCAHLRRDPGLGLIGPVTNNIGNEAKLVIAYGDIVDMHRVAGAYTRAHPGGATPMHNAAFFCVAMSRTVYETIGGLDEAFGVGFFEDDDYCRRVHQAGLRIACAEDVFVHHHLSASFDKLSADRKRELFERNKEIYESKWGPWQAHAYRPSQGAPVK